MTIHTGIDNFLKIYNDTTTYVFRKNDDLVIMNNFNGRTNVIRNYVILIILNGSNCRRTDVIRKNDDMKDIFKQNVLRMIRKMSS